jgi:hypothetical protein
MAEGTLNRDLRSGCIIWEMQQRRHNCEPTARVAFRFRWNRKSKCFSSLATSRSGGGSQGRAFFARRVLRVPARAAFARVG